MPAPDFDALEDEVRASLDRHGFSGFERCIAIARVAINEWRGQGITKERAGLELIKLWDRAQERFGGGADLYGKRPR